MAVTVTRRDDWINVKQAPHNARGDGVTDDTAEIQAAIDAASIAGSSAWYSTSGAKTVFLPPGVYVISDLITIPGWVNVRGSGARSTIFKAAHADAGFTVTGSGGAHGGFGFDGDGLATKGLHLPFTNQNTYTAIEVRGCVLGMHLENCQNALFLQVNCTQNETGLQVDSQASSNLFLRCEYASNTVRGIYLPFTTGNCSSNRWDTCIVEASPTTSMWEQLHGSASLVNTIIAGSSDSGKQVIVGPMGGSSCTLLLDGAAITGGQSGAAALEINQSGEVISNGFGNYIGGDSGMTGVSFAHSSARLRGIGPRINGPGTEYAYAGGATRLLCQNTLVRNAIELNLATAGERALWTHIGGQVPFILAADGTMSWASSTSGLADTDLYRAAANQLKTDDKFLAALGIGVGNSAAATTLGSVTKKMEVFNASGVSLGFVPIYDAIT